MSGDYRLFLKDIVEALESIENFTKGDKTVSTKVKETLGQSGGRKYGVERGVMMLGSVPCFIDMRP